MISARRWSRRTDLTIDTAGSGWPTRRRRAVARLLTSSSHTARGSERAHVEFDDGAAAWSEVVPQNASARCPVDTRLGRDGDSAVARAQEEVRVGLPAVRLRRGEARHPFRWLFGERVENR